MKKLAQVISLALALDGISIAVASAATVPQAKVPTIAALPTHCGANVNCIRTELLYGGSGPVQAPADASRLTTTDSTAEVRACPEQSVVLVAERYLKAVLSGQSLTSVPCAL